MKIMIWKRQIIVSSKGKRSIQKKIFKIGENKSK
jgi:hypothetical protein